MKYQKLENLEAGWRWTYLHKKMISNENVTRWIDSSEIKNAFNELNLIASEQIKVSLWIDKHISTSYIKKLNQSLRAKRKRYFDSEQKHTKKKSIDLDFLVWQKLSEFSIAIGCTLSESVEYLLSETDNKI